MSTNPNKYAGECACGKYVNAGRGFYQYDQVYCTEPVEIEGMAGFFCEVDARSELRLREQIASAPIVEHVPTEGELARQAERAQQDAEWERQGMKRCMRCAGRGGSRQWHDWVCYDCGGEGCLPDMEVK